MGEAPKKERLNNLLIVTQLQGGETRKGLAGTELDPKAVAWAPPPTRTAPQTVLAK